MSIIIKTRIITNMNNQFYYISIFSHLRFFFVHFFTIELIYGFQYISLYFFYNLSFNLFMMFTIYHLTKVLQVKQIVSHPMTSLTTIRSSSLESLRPIWFSDNKIIPCYLFILVLKLIQCSDLKGVENDWLSDELWRTNP